MDNLSSGALGDAARAWRAERDAALAKVVPIHGEASATKPLRFKAVRARALGPPTGEDWLIKGLLPKEGVGTFFGSSGSSSRSALSTSRCTSAIGERWAGRMVIQADAVYVASEGAAGAADASTALWRPTARPTHPST